MGLAKRLEEQAREGRITEEAADDVLADRESLWNGQEQSGQMILVFDN